MSNLTVVETKTETKVTTALKPDICRDHYAQLSVLNIFADCHKDGADAHETRCLSATVELSAGDLLDAAKKAVPHGYNGFNHRRLVKIIEAIFGETTEDVQATRRAARDYRFRFGRESSPVLYIRSTHRIWKDLFDQIAKASGADEISIEADGSIRLWWD